mgnify:FL=1
MVKVGLISDTHGYLDNQVLDFFEDCDEIWHAGDFGSLKIARALQEVAPLRGVYGNIDGNDIRKQYPLHERITIENLDVWITHIGGNPGRYCLPIRREIEHSPPDVFICGHSHMLKIARDKDNEDLLFINPGAAGKQGFHNERTIVRFTLDDGTLNNVQVINLSVGQEKDKLKNIG